MLQAPAGCTEEKLPNGLVLNHAFGITDVTKVCLKSCKFMLLQPANHIVLSANLVDGSRRVCEAYIKCFV